MPSASEATRDMLAGAALTGILMRSKTPLALDPAAVAKEAYAIADGGARALHADKAAAA